MASQTNIALELISDTLEFLKSNTDACLGSQEDYEYFRQILRKSSAPAQAPKPIEPPVAFIPVQSIPVAAAAPPVPVIAETIIPTPVAVPMIPKEIVVPAPKFEPAVEIIRPKAMIGSWKTLFAKVAPQLSIIQEIPSDAIAKKINTRWKTKNQIAPISILFFQEIPEQKALLEQIAKAIDVYFGPAKIVFAEQIEKEKQWEAFLGAPELKHIVCCDYSLWQLSNLMKFYKEVPATKSRLLGEKPLFLLPDLSLYVKDPLLKRSLWKALCQTLSSHRSS